MLELSEDAKAVYEALSSDGAKVGKQTLLRKLRIDTDRFLKAKEELLRFGFIVIGRGRGGGIGRKTIEVSVEKFLKPTSIKMPLSESAKKILASLPLDGSMVGNAFLRKQLGMDASEFFKAKLELQQKGQVVTGKGRGGSIGLAKIRGSSSMPDRGGGVEDEGELYEPIKKYFDDEWGLNVQSPDYYCAEITGTPKGYKRKSGLWSRPDVSILTVSSYQFLPTKQIEVTTVEAKKYRDAAPQAVFETASQSKVAHQSYLVIEWLDDTNLDDTDNGKRILDEARRWGIGLIQMKQNDRGGWDFREILDPQKRIPDPDECNTFIERTFRPHHKQLLGALGKG